MSDSFKGFPICDKHKTTYRRDKGCEKCKSERPLKKLDQVFKEMEEAGLLPKVGGDGKKDNNTN